MIWGITAYFNPSGFRRPLENYRRFSAGVRRQGLPLLAVELAFGDDPYALTEDDADIVVRRRSDTILWHKERLLNIAMQHLPGECREVCWLDSDVVFANDAWIEDTRRALDHAAVVQPFSHCVWLPPGRDHLDLSETDYPRIGGDYGRHHSFAFGWRHFGRPALEARVLSGHVGFAWAAKRGMLERLGLYDAGIAGSGDDMMAHAFVGSEAFARNQGRRHPPALLRHLAGWAARAYAEGRGNLDYVNGDLFHLWHGHVLNRQYLERIEGLSRYGYDPASHIRLDHNGLYRWTEQAPPELVNFVRSYFSERREDLSTGHNGQAFWFKKGFHDDEGGFRWALSTALLQVATGGSTLRFRLGSNVLDRFETSQSIDIYVNGRLRHTVHLRDNRPVPVALHGLRLDDLVRFESDFRFKPRDHGEMDARTLSFMFFPDHS